MGSKPRRDALRPPLGTINVIFTALGRTGSCHSRIMFVAWLYARDSNFKPKRAKMSIQSTLSFSDEYKDGTIQSYNDALVITLRIGGV